VRPGFNAARLKRETEEQTNGGIENERYFHEAVT
jgi:hypothetical protein